MATNDYAVTLIQCTDSKRDEMAMAKDLYDESRYFRKMRKWAEARDDPWFILSAKHGLAAPNEPIEPYDAYGLSDSQAIGISLLLSGLGFETVHLTAGMAYTDPLVPELEQDGLDVVNHFAGEPIGRREKLLSEATESLRNDP